MLKKLLILCIAIAPMVAVAQNAQVAVVNTQEIIMAMPELSDIERQLANRMEEMEGIMRELETLYNSQMEALQALPEGTSEAILSDRIRELQQTQERFESFVRNGQRELHELEARLFEPVTRRVLDAIGAVAEEAGYLLVFDVNSPAFISPNAPDITQRVRTRLNI